MLRTLGILVMAFILVVSNFFGLERIIIGNTNTQSTVAAESSDYEIYPLPQNETYLGEKFTLTDEVNIVSEDTIDESTMNFLNEIFESKSIKIGQSDSIVSDKTNIIIGTRGSNEYVDDYFNEYLKYDETIFKETDAYVLSIDNKQEERGVIAILGADTDAAYYALASLKMIFDQIPGKELQTVKYEDYADTKWRGFIEGFYGFPWSDEDRKSLMRFGGKLKMNSYIFAPKDDPYHNEKWRTLYPEDELAKVKELVDVGQESKTHFIWAIHPGFNMINWDDYDNELDKLLTKLDQLYGIGVRQFGLFMDDISTTQSLTDTDKHMKLVKDVARWVEGKKDVKPLIYTPPFYNQAWTGEVGKPYLQAMGDLPENVEIVWTGKDVIGSVNTEDMQWPKDEIGRDTYVWFNWPVNGYKQNRLLLGKLELLHPGTHNISGVVSNPLEQAELSKISLFGVADFTWNVDDFDDEQSWLDSFKHIAPEVASELNTIAYHMSDPSPNSRGVEVGESENIKKKLELFLSQFDKQELEEEAGEDLIAEFDHILNAIETFKEKSTNDAMLEEIKPWLNSLEYVVKSSKHAAKSAMILQNGDIDAAWEDLAIATSAMSNSKKFTRPVLHEADKVVEAGAKRLVPFANELISKLDAQIHTSIDPEATVLTPITSYDSQLDLKPMIDGDASTYVYIQTVQKNGDWYGIDLGKTTRVNDISILQGRDDDDHDIFQKGMLEYSTDGENWTAIGKERSGYKIDVKNIEIEARYVRYRLTHAGIPGGKPDLWTAIRGFTINADNKNAVVYTNVADLKETAVDSRESSAEIKNINDLTLNPLEYIGIKLPSIEQIANIKVDSKHANFVLEASENGVEWEEVEHDVPYPTAAYVRLINKSEQAVTFDLDKLLVELRKFSDPVISQNLGGIHQGKLENMYDGNPETKVWFNGPQLAGKYVQVDMGGMVDVENVAVVINDGEKDYFRKGDLQISMDGEDWETIHSFANPDNVALNFPEHEAPYRYMRANVDKKQARYIRLISTEDSPKWLALNGIIVNEGLEQIGIENPALKVDPAGEVGNEGIQAIDRKLSTFYTPKGDPSPGYLNYKLSNETELSDLIILQSPTAISNAKVSVRGVDGWQQIGSLSKSYNTLNTSELEHVLEIKIEWNGAVNPEIYEIIPVKREKDDVPPVNNASDMKSLVERFEEDGEFKGGDTAHALKLHLTAVERYEKKEKAEKVVKHMKSFKLLLDHQKESKLISDKAYQVLTDSADTVINNQ